MASDACLADAAWRVKRTTPAISIARDTAIAHGKQHMALPQHLRRELTSLDNVERD